MSRMNGFQKDALKVCIYERREQMGAAAARDIEEEILRVLSRRSMCNVIFAAAPSQNEVLAALAASDAIPWERVRAFHMDEYIGLSASAPQGFANFLRRALFDKVPFASVYCMDSTAPPQMEAERYAALLQTYPADIVVLGVGENGHIAFNDPHEAWFDDAALVKCVELDDVCRMQQVHDGCFDALERVPHCALTLTVPALCAAHAVFCIVPGRAKAQAVCRMLEEPVSEACPASILRRHPNAKLYLDADSAAALRR